VNFSPDDAKKHYNICRCVWQQLTIGVEQRVEELADREQGFVLKDAIPYKKLIPLSELISMVLDKAVTTKSVWNEYKQKLSGKMSLM
jgi:PHP family Zn ribbon phosphoesterase